jgi:glycosyltransferase involved in cell wall biosynthesis
MSTSTAVIVATKGRPRELSNLLDALAAQTVQADLIVVSATDRSDLPPIGNVESNIKTIFGPSGSSAQRNRALEEVRGKCDIIIFFDDDFIPSRFWIENTERLFAAYADVIGLTGEVLADGARTGGIEWSDGRSIVDKTDASCPKAIRDSRVRDGYSPYGCNMAFRAKSIEHLTFDERLVLYGWLEDRDFSFRAGKRMIWTDLVWGVHLGARNGRTSGRKFGYSQIVNPWYLMTKGTMPPLETLAYMARSLLRNAIGTISKDAVIDRRGRLSGNLTGIRDIVCRDWAPEKAAEI